MLKIRLTARNEGAIVKVPNKPTEGSGPRATLYPFLSVEYVGSCVEHVDKATLADPRSCPNIGDHLRAYGGRYWTRTSGLRRVNAIFGSFLIVYSRSPKFLMCTNALFLKGIMDLPLCAVVFRDILRPYLQRTCSVLADNGGNDEG